MTEKVLPILVATDAEVEERLEDCDDCESRTTARCRCVRRKGIRLRNVCCPLGKWPDILPKREQK